MAMSSKGGSATDPLSYMMGGQDFPLFDPGPTKADRWRTGLMAAGEALTSLGAGSGPTFEATDAWLKDQARQRILGQAQKNAYGEKLEGRRENAAARNATAQWLATQGPKGEALANAVASGAMTGADAIKAFTDPKAVIPGVDGGVTPMDQETADKYTDSLRDDLKTEVQTLSATNAAITGLQSALQSNNAMDIRSAVTLFSKLIDPTTGVLGGEAAAVLGSAGMAQNLIDTIYREVEQGGLTDGTRQQLVDAATRIAEARRKNFVDIYGPAIENAKTRGIDPADLFVPDFVYRPYTSLNFGAPTATPEPRSPLLDPPAATPPAATPAPTTATPAPGPAPTVAPPVALPPEARPLLDSVVMGEPGGIDQLDAWASKNLNTADQAALVKWLFQEGYLE